MTNALYGPPQAPQDNALMRDPQSMTLNDMLRAAESMTMRPLAKGERPADPLRWAADYYVGQNKDLPAPQFFMDPRALSARNMLHSALNTSANWLDGTRDPSRIGPEEIIAPLGLAGMGTGLANALSRPGRDFRIADDLARQHPGASAVGDVPRFAPLRDASNPTGAAYVADFGSMPTAPRAPGNANATPYAVMADNAKGSAPGTVVNSLDPGGSSFHEKVRRRSSYLDAKLQRAEEKKAAWAEKRGTSPAPAKPTEPDSIAGNLMAVPRGIAVTDGNAGWRVTDRPSFENAKDGIRPAPQIGVKFPRAGRPANDLSASPSASAPGLAANSTQQDDQGVMSILRRYGLAD